PIKFLATSLTTGASTRARPEPIEQRGPAQDRGIHMLRVSSITLAVLLVVGLLTTVPFHAQQAGGRGGGGGEAPAGGGPGPPVDERTSGMQKLDGYFPLYWDERSGSLFLEIPRLDTEFLLSSGLAAGLGSNDIGLDRGQGGQGRVVRFE